MTTNNILIMANTPVHDSDVYEALTVRFAIGIDPNDKLLRMYYDDIHHLRDFIIRSYEDISPFSDWVGRKIYLCLSKLDTDGINIKTHRWEVDETGHVDLDISPITTMGYRPPRIDNILVPKELLFQYMGAYSK